MFRYLADPMFLVVVAAYLVNRFVLEPFTRVPFFHSYLNDLICVPVLVPPMLWAGRRLGVRVHNHPPTAFEIVIPVIVWSMLFEVILPQSTFWRRWITGDPYDVLCYAIGGFIASTWWNFYYWEKTNDEVAAGNVTQPQTP